MEKSFFIDTTICTGCRGCQVACKQWHDLPAESTKNLGTFQNPPDLSFMTYKLVRMKEELIENKLNWLFFPDQCRHCIEAPCLEIAENSNAIYKDASTGAILYTAKTKELDADAIIESCPYNIPRKREDGTLAKCDMCNDRVHNGLKPACVQTCPTGTMQFGDRQEMLDMANKRIAEVKAKFPKASLLNSDTLSVIYLVAHEPKFYHDYAVASSSKMERGISRKVALRKMMGPFASLVRV
ncbi:MAG: formate dehydrogenase [Desulfamplus sp.]|nr:formate dehydrogenase [Desulfamplus sp.]